MPAMTPARIGPRLTASWMPATSSTSHAISTNPTSPAISRNLVPTRARARRSDHRGLCIPKFYAARALRGPEPTPRIPSNRSNRSMAKNRGTDAQLLTMHELAAYLHLDEATVSKLVMQGKIPSLQVDRQWRFKRAAIDEWIEQQLVGDDESFADVPDGMKLPLEDLLPDQAIITNLRAKTAMGVIEELAARAYTNGWLVDKPWFVGAVVERESL